MIYLGLAWRLLGYSAWIMRAAMTLIATATVASLYVLARRIANPEIAAWSALLLALSPLFFAQTTLAHLDLAAALFTTLAVLFILGDRFWLFALAASLAVLSKETAVVLLPVVWPYAWRRGRDSRSDAAAHLFQPDSACCSSRAAGGLDALLPPRHGLLDGQPRLPELQFVFHAIAAHGFSGVCCDAPTSFSWADSIGCLPRAPRSGLWWERKLLQVSMLPRGGRTGLAALHFSNCRIGGHLSAPAERRGWRDFATVSTSRLPVLPRPVAW